MILKLSIFLLTFSSTALLSLQILPSVFNLLKRPVDKKVGEVEKQLDTMFLQVDKKRLALLYVLPPVAIGFLGLILSQNFIFMVVGIVLGLSLPAFVIKRMQTMRRARLQAQLIDGVLVLSSSLKGGLSLLQAIEVLVEELPPPISQELGLVLRENKMGIALDESLRRLSERMNLEELSLLINSILVAKETGGDLTKVLGRLSVTIRDNQKIKENIKTLTLQGRMQGLIMSAIPFFFIFGVLSTNRHHFDIMFETEVGRFLLILGVILLAVGLILVRKFSSIRI